MALTQNLNAILNYAKLKATLPQDLLTMTEPTGSVAGNWAKIYFTGEGDIITHGRNYTPVFEGGAKGLVPLSNHTTGAKLQFLGNDGNWKELSVNELPIAPSFSIGADATEGVKYVYNARQVYEHFHELIAAVDAMRFKGAFDPNNTAGFPKDGKVEIGDTYRVTQSGTYAGYKVLNGDLLICIKEPENNKDLTADDVDGFTGSEGTSVGEYWMVVESNINGTTAHTVNGSRHIVYTSEPSEQAFNIYAPTTGGTQGQILISNGDSAPDWIDLKNLTVGGLTTDLKALIAGGYLITGAGTFQLKNLNGDLFGTQYVTNLDNDDWNINIKGKSNGTKQSLTLDAGLAFDGGKTSFNGSTDTVLKLMPATKDSIGGVVIDNRTNIADDLIADKFAKVSTISVEANTGMIYLTYENICNALGFEPGNVTAVAAYNIILGNDAKSTTSPADLPTLNPFFNLTSKDAKTGSTTVAGSIQFTGNSSIKVSAVTNNDALTNKPNNTIYFDLLTATTDYLGGIKVAKTNTNSISSAFQVTGDTHDKNNKYYGIELDNTGKAFVYVPWEDTKNAFSQISVKGGAGIADATINADSVESTFSLIAGNGINLITNTTDKSITINQNVWKVVTANEMGYAPKMDKNEVEMDRSYYILSFTGDAENPSWNKLPSGAFMDTWRAILVGGTQVANTEAINAQGDTVGKALNFTTNNIEVDALTTKTNHASLTYSEGTDSIDINIFSTWRDIYFEDYKMSDNYSLRFVSSDDLELVATEDADNSVNGVTFELSWYNLDTQQRETVK